MGINNDYCPDNDILMKYLFSQLPFKEVSKIEEHFYKCGNCTNKTRKYSQAMTMLDSLKACNIAAPDYSGSVYDIVMLPAAASSKNNGVSEVNSIDNKFTLRLIPFLDENKSVLEIRLNDSNIEGIVTIENKDGLIFKSEISHGFASEEVNNPIDLREVLIKVTKK